MYAVFDAWKCSYGLMCCAVTEQQCWTAAVCVTAPASCFDTVVCRGLTQYCVSCFDTACVPCFDHSSVSVGLTRYVSRALTQQSATCFDIITFVVLGHSKAVSCLTHQRCSVF